MRKIRLFTGLTAVAVLAGGMLLAGQALAQNKEKPGPKNGPKMAQLEARRPLMRCFLDNMEIRRHLKDKLNLTQDQMQKIHAIMQSHKDEIASVLSTLNEKNKALLAAVRADKVDEAAIRAAATAMAGPIGDASVLRAKIRQEVLGVLTADQRAKLDAALDEIQDNRDEAVNEVGNK